jgi:hypothetical protein
MSALKLGLSARTSVLPGEDPAAFRRLRNLLIADLAPVGALEVFFVEQLAVSQWRLARCEAAEASLMSTAIAQRRFLRLQRDGRQRDEEKHGPKSQSPASVLPSHDFVAGDAVDPEPAQRAELDLLAFRDGEASDLGAVFSDNGESLALILRYRTATERAHLRTAHELERLQAIRAGRDVPMPVAVDVTVDAAPGESLDRLESRRSGKRSSSRVVPQVSG